MHIHAFPAVACIVEVRGQQMEFDLSILLVGPTDRAWVAWLGGRHISQSHLNLDVLEEHKPWMAEDRV